MAVKYYRIDPKTGTYIKFHDDGAFTVGSGPLWEHIILAARMSYNGAPHTFHHDPTIALTDAAELAGWGCRAAISATTFTLSVPIMSSDSVVTYLSIRDIPLPDDFRRVQAAPAAPFRF